MSADRAVFFRLRTCLVDVRVALACVFTWPVRVFVDAILWESAFAVEDLKQCPACLQAASAGIADMLPNTTAATRPVISRFFILFPSIYTIGVSMTGNNDPIIFIRLSPFE
jgi:hypothetical protein